MVNLIVKKKNTKKKISQLQTRHPNTEILDYSCFPVKQNIRKAVVSEFYHKSKTETNKAEKKLTLSQSSSNPASL